MKLKSTRLIISSNVLFLILLLLFNTTTTAQITITGIDGLTFNKTGSDYTLALTDNFTIHGMGVEPDGLTLEWDQSEDKFTIYGGLNLTIEGDVLNVDLGTSGDPGIIITNETLESVTFGITAEFTMKDLTFHPQDLTFHWDKSEDQYEMYGTITLDIEDDNLAATFGDDASPGLIISNGEVQNLNISVSAEFTLKSISFDPQDLTFKWNRADDKFVMYGDITVTVEADDIDATFGDETTPGVTIVNGAVDDLNISVTADFTMKDLSFNPQDMTFRWNRAADKYEIFGEITVAVEDDNIDATFGDETTPGVTIVNGAVDELNISVTADFSMKDITFNPQDVTFQWKRADDRYEIFGEIKVNVDDDKLDATFGDEASPGILISNGTVDQLEISVTSVFSMKGLSFTTKDATFYWNRADDLYLFYGSFSVDFESDEIDVTMGDSEHPGVVIENGNLTKIHLTVDADFEMKGLSIQATDAGIRWYRETYGDIFGIYGDLKLNIDGQELEAYIGDDEHPGIVYHAGTVTTIYIRINSDFKIGNLDVEAKSLTLQYHDEIYHITGEMTITDVWTLDVDLGSGSNSGIEVDVSGSSDKFLLESLVITLDNANLGSIDFKKIQLTFEDNKLEEADMIASFPPGWEVEGKIQFTTGDHAEISGATIVWETDNLDDAIEIPGTGMAIVYISGNLYDLNEPSDIHFDGTVGLAFGGPFEVDGYDLAFFYLAANIEINHSELVIDTDIDVGAYKHDGDWHSLLGDGDLDVKLVWNDYYKIDGKFKIPTDPMIEASLDAEINKNKTLDALLDVEFIVPSWVPFIHGKHFGSVDGALRYLDGHATSSYAAGWIKWDLWLTDVYEGAKYNFGEKKASHIGHSSIDDIKDEIKDDEKYSNLDPLYFAADDYTQLIKSFVIDPKAPTMVRVGLTWETEIDTAYVNVMGPDGVMNLVSLTVVDDGDSNSVPTITPSENLTFVDSETGIDFLIFPASSITEDKSVEKASLTPGEYQVFFSYNPAGGEIDSLSIIATKHHPVATGTITADQLSDGSIDLNLDYWAYHPDSSLISIYANDSAAYNGKLIDHIPYGTLADDGSGSAVFNYVPENMNKGTSAYFYYVIDDGINVPFYSEFTQPVIYTPPIYGTVTLIDPTAEGDSTYQGFTVYIDESGDGKYDTESTGGLEPSCVSDAEGEFEFHALETGTYSINIIIPSGFVLDETSPNQLPLSVDYNETPQEVNFTIRKEN